MGCMLGLEPHGFQSFAVNHNFAMMSLNLQFATPPAGPPPVLPAPTASLPDPVWRPVDDRTTVHASRRVLRRHPRVPVPRACTMATRFRGRYGCRRWTDRLTADVRAWCPAQLPPQPENSRRC